MPGPQGAAGAPTMSLGKLSPVGWVSSSQGKRRLTADMISPPLGDFRHTMHVGRGGDVFGDTSFLSNHGGSGASGTHRSPRSFLARKLQQVRRAGAPPRRVASPPTPSPAPPAVSPIIKNAISLPQLNQATYDSLVVGQLSFDASPASSTDSHSGYGLDSGFCTISRLPHQDKPREREAGLGPEPPTLRRSDSLLSFRLDLDLGPSLLSELLGVMSLSGGPSAETPNPVPATSPQTPAACSLTPATCPPTPATCPPTPATCPPTPATRGRCLNGVSSGRGLVAGARSQAGGAEGPRVPTDVGGVPSRHWGAGWGGSSQHPTGPSAGSPRAGGSWESLDGEWGSPRGSGRSPAVPHAVQASSFAFADAEDDDDEVKV